MNASHEKSVLVVEDNAMNLKLIRGILELNGLKVVAAQDAEKAIELVRETRPDLILMDIELPGMDGLTATRLLKNDPELCHIPVVALSAHAMQEDFLKAREAGCVAYFTKPIDKKPFLQALQSLLGRKTGESPPSISKTHPSKILVVDDDPLNVKLIAATLGPFNHEIHKAYCGKEALQLVREKRPDLILLDVMMPDMNGYEVTSCLKGDPATSEIPIILVTALDSKEDKKRGQDAGADDFLNKPVNPSELQTRVSSLIKLKIYKEQVVSRKQPFCEDQQGLEPEAGEGPTLLLVEDDPASVRLIEAYLEDIPCRIRLVKDGTGFMEAVSRERPDVILLDILLPEIDGFELCRELKNDSATFPIQVIMVTTLDDLKSRVRGIELGADEFLVKPVNPEELRARVRAAFRKKAYIDQLARKVHTNWETALIDAESGFYNRHYLEHFLGKEVRRCQERHHSFSISMIRFGEDAFQKNCSREVYWPIVFRAIQNNIREIDFVARFDQNSCMVVLPYADKKVAEQISGRLESRLIEKFCRYGMNISVHDGVVTFPADAGDAENLIRKAETALIPVRDQNPIANQPQTFGENK